MIIPFPDHDLHPVFKVGPGCDLVLMVEEITALLIAADLRIYRRDTGVLIFVYNQEYSDKIYAQPERLQSPRMGLFMSRVAKFTKYSERRDEWLPVDPPGALARLIIKHGSFPAYDEAADAARHGAA